MIDLNQPAEVRDARRGFLRARFLSAKEAGGTIGCGCANVTGHGNGVDEVWCSTHRHHRTAILGGTS